MSFESPQFAGGMLTINAVLYKPSGPVKGTVVLVHGSGGWSDGREGYWGRALSAAGYAALAIDTFGPRGIGSTVSDQGKLASLQQAQDAFAARRYLLGLGYAEDKTAIMGFSRGGTVSMQAADRNYLPAQKDRFSVSIPFYPGCTTRPREAKPASKLFLVLAEKDDWVGTRSCLESAAGYASAGGSVKTRIYPNAAHGFDGDPAHVRMFRLSDAETFMDCVSILEPDGSFTFNDKTFPRTGVGLLAEMRKTCAKRGATVWTNIAQKEAVTKDVIEFLDGNL
ncbi:dienelactone hydrolase family protein [Variovorax sp. J22R133]|uniref:dienelactone hydrolase family protein n=1 Tax=Variovorax brevis TaxID=3053503 RepID=UPI00257773B6|nr:dienelactone hydrolase family protein [Variovorax sp. J22R133]MDM0114377.1 dienelactone hydrolase family protein [Variovorax sp. J22R133]